MDAELFLQKLYDELYGSSEQNQLSGCGRKTKKKINRKKNKRRLLPYYIVRKIKSQRKRRKRTTKTNMLPTKQNLTLDETSKTEENQQKMETSSIKSESSEELLLNDQQSSTENFRTVDDCIVIVENLSNDTSKKIVVRMAKQFGKVKNIKMERQFYRALISFAEQNAALKFLEAYQRAMVDLSIIKIRIKDQEVDQNQPLSSITPAIIQ